MPWTLDIDPEIQRDIKAYGKAEVSGILSFLKELQDCVVPADLGWALQNGGYYTQTKERIFIAWDVPDSEDFPGTEFPVIRVLGVGSTIRTYEHGSQIFNPW